MPPQLHPPKLEHVLQYYSCDSFFFFFPLTLSGLLASPNVSSRSTRSTRQNTPSLDLIDYSSAEDESQQQVQPSPAAAATAATTRQRRISASQRNNKQQQQQQQRSEPRPSRINGHGRLANYSEEEDEEDGEDEEDSEDMEEEEEEEVDDDDDDDEEEEEDDDEDDEDEDDEEVDDDDDEIVFKNARVDFGGQTSPGMDNSSSDSPIRPGIIRSNGGASPMRFSAVGGGNRFASSTPVNSVASTSAYISRTSPQSRFGNGCSPSPPPSAASSTFPNLMSPHLRRSISNSKDFGSLGEALSSLPNHATNNGHGHHLVPHHHHHHHHQQQQQQQQQHYSPSNILTQAAQQQQQQQRQKQSNSLSTHHNKKSVSNHHSSSSASSNSSLSDQNQNYRNVHCISKLIIAFAGVFFAFIFYQYASLRPSNNIRSRIPVCGSIGLPSNGTCVPDYEIDAFVNIYENFISSLNEDYVDHVCGPRSLGEETAAPVAHGGGSSSSPSISLHDLLREVPKNQHALAHLVVKVLSEKPYWGIRLLNRNHEETLPSMEEGEEEEENRVVQFLAVSHPRLDWTCWASIKLSQIFTNVCIVGVYIVYGVILTGILYGSYLVYVWRKERKVQEQQEVFELVEQVLSRLVTNLQLGRAAGGPGMNSSRPLGLAVNHIRDELIPPAERSRKKKIWQKVVQYIRESESRVKEDLQIMGGEEVRVWYWIPDRLHWKTPPMNQHGPNPYLPAAATNPYVPIPRETMSVSMSHAPTHTVTPSAPPSWQGSAFNILDKTKASPSVAPTSCLKVRSGFYESLKGNLSGQWEAKEEILRRCSHAAKILHVAFDTESPEVCCYIKCASSEDAGKVFKLIHGQWYRATLVTAKYLRDERYYERFPDTRQLKEPLKPQQQT